jgi:hypothetical protein
MDLWDTAMVAFVIVSVIAFSLWARIRATASIEHRSQQKR